MKHVTRVHDVGWSTHYAKCSCGWTGPDCQGKRLAREDAATHRKEVRKDGHEAIGK